MDLVFLHGGAGAGKLTVARELGSRLGYGVFHNHLVVDALTAVFPFGSPEFVRLREQFWLATFDAATSADASLVFTFAPEATVASGFPGRARDVVERGGGRIHFVRLLVSDEEQERRITLPSRREFAKLADVDTLHRLRATGRDEEVEQPPSDLTIDTELLEPAAAAALIQDAFELRPITPRLRYPPLD